MPPHALPYFALSQVTGDTLSIGEIERLLADVDATWGLLECARLDRVLTLGGFEDHPFQRGAADAAIDLHYQSKLIATQKVFRHKPIVFHDRVLRCLAT